MRLGPLHPPRTPAALVALGLLWGAAAAAQRPSPPAGAAPGSRVRVILRQPALGLPDNPADPRGTQLLATLVAQDSGWLQLAFANGRRQAVPTDAVSRLYVSRGPGYCTGPARRTVCVAGGAALGAALGAAVGSLFTVAGTGGESLRCADEWEIEPQPCRRKSRWMAGAVAGTLMGALAGVATGRERWTRVPLAAPGG